MLGSAGNVASWPETVKRSVCNVVQLTVHYRCPQDCEDDCWYYARAKRKHIFIVHDKYSNFNWSRMLFLLPCFIMRSCYVIKQNTKTEGICYYVLKQNNVHVHKH